MLLKYFYDTALLKHGDRFSIGKIEFEVLYKIGIDQIEGYFDADSVADAGLNLQSFEEAMPAEIAPLVASGELTLIDVRGDSEWKEKHIPQAKRCFLANLPEQLNKFTGDCTLVFQSQSGGRSAIAASLAQAAGRGTILSVLLVGLYFGIVLTKSEVVRWQRVHDMFLFREPFMYLIIGTGVAVAMISMLPIRKFGVMSIQDRPITYQAKPFNTGAIVGGMIFGAGWAITGACPGPIYAQIGGGEWMALFTLAGAMAGMFLYAWLKPKLPH